MYPLAPSEAYPLSYKYPCWDAQHIHNKQENLFSLTAYVISDLGRLLLPVPVVLDVPPLDLQGVGGRACPAEGTSHLYILPALRCDVVWNLCKESCRRKIYRTEIT